jgi:superfamily I DNA and/or RNA helicase
MVRFTLSRTTLRTSHRACLELARKNLGRAILEPTRAIVQQYRAERLAHEQQEQQQHSPARIPRTTLSFANPTLNPEQQGAVYQIVNDKGGHTLPYILFGPPGTGKTTVVVEAVYQLAVKHMRTGQESPTILLAAPSNDAADILVARLGTYFPPKLLLRVLAYSRNRADLPADILPFVNQHEEDGEEKLNEILKAKIVVSTVNLAARFVYVGVPKGHFHVICIDEAGHATEPELVAVAASLLDTRSPNSQLILAGDPKQLGPITTSKICESYGLGISLMERLSQRSVYQRNEETHQYPHDLLTKLVRNYRSHPALLRLPNEMFYDGELVCSADRMMTHTMARWEHLPNPGFPILFHSIQGENLREANSPSWFNPQEAQQVVAYVKLLLRETRPPLREEEIGIITPYARQAQKIRAALQVSLPGQDEIKVGSVECFQGQERRVIILSTVRSEPELYLDHDIRYNLGFIAHPKRFNVAMTRAKALLIVIGCPSVLALDKENWLPFLQYCHENGAIVGEPWDPSSAAEDSNDDNDGAPDDHHQEDAGDEIVVDTQVNELTNMLQSWDLVQAEETFAYVNREE